VPGEKGQCLVFNKEHSLVIKVPVVLVRRHIFPTGASATATASASLKLVSYDDDDDENTGKYMISIANVTVKTFFMIYIFYWPQ
jgi:hypothetical protein